MSVTLVGTGLDNGLLPVWRQAIVLTSAGLSLIRPTGTIFKLSLMTTLFNIWSANWQPSFVCACVLPPIFCLTPFVQVLDWYFWIATFFELGLAFQEWEVDIAFCGGLVSSGHKPLPESMLTPLGQKSDFIPQSLPLLVWSALEQPRCIQGGIPTVGVAADGWAWLSVVNKVGQILFSRSQ